MIEKHVCSLEHAKKLKNIGFTKTTLHTWTYDKKDESWDIYSLYRPSDYDIEILDIDEFPAFTATELLELLKSISKNHYIQDDINIMYFKESRNEKNEYIVQYLHFCFYDKNLCNALADMLFLFVKNEYLF